MQIQGGIDSEMRSMLNYRVSYKMGIQSFLGTPLSHNYIASKPSMIYEDGIISNGCRSPESKHSN